ncbi:hypothetical protein [Halarcobacter anaerophilus]|uniref:DnaA N-terminal domain-containing protein n=1 Tax=Halarcobacter anaerophilus TaxID=877500 RepID=A0A4Q0Y5H8_9BACT|nr:hypothetical protein [Halarcobacter anaerophilus]QDF28976.1 hypothetical protein AANAER_1496 [Halarcobacter anaerophilus]RXJ63611.1 hypothetical protein CRV06_05305 [Halarcobacter anaerophilus]
MNYLVEKTKLTIEPNLAKEIGLNEAIFIKQLDYWLKKSTKLIDDKKWVFNTVDQWQIQFPFWSKNTVIRTIEKLKKNGCIYVKQLDTNLLNRTNWYSINYEKIEELKLKINKEKPLPKSEKKVEKLQKKLPNEGAERYSKEFLAFWEFYPKKYGKRGAYNEFKQLNQKLQAQAIYGAQKYSLQTSQTEEKFIKIAKKWLSEGYYEDYEIKSTDIVQRQSQDTVAVLNQKITELIKITDLAEVEIWNQMRGKNYIFSSNEQSILKNLGNDIDAYKEMEFRPGEIKAYLRGVLE